MSGQEYPNQSRSKDRRIKSEASDWIAKQDLGFTAGEQDAFFEWLGSDPRHGEAFGARKSVWNDLDVLAQWRPEHSLEPNPDLLAISRRRSVIRWTVAVSTLAAVFLMGLLLKNPWSSNDADQGVMLALGDGAQFYEHHLLEDGSVVELNRGAQVFVQYLADKRLIKLMSGEAHFTVAKDKDRPFIVQARNTVVQAVGTAFNVSLNSEEIEVLVTEGRVWMKAALEPETDAPIENFESPTRELNAGQLSSLSLRIDSALPVIETISPQQISRRLAWKNEVLNFTATPLSEVILEFNRRNHTQMVIADASLAAREVTATLRPNNLDGFLELIELTLQVRIKRESSDKIVLFSTD